LHLQWGDFMVQARLIFKYSIFFPSLGSQRIRQGDPKQVLASWKPLKTHSFEEESQKRINFLSTLYETAFSKIFISPRISKKTKDCSCWKSFFTHSQHIGAFYLGFSSIWLPKSLLRKIFLDFKIVQLWIPTWLKVEL